MRRIAIINQKGGVGKTTTTVNVGMGLARAGNRVLLLDLDPQAHLSLHLGVDPQAGQPGVYEMLTANASIAKARVKAGNNLWIVSSSIDLAAAETELAGTIAREVILRDLLEQHVKANSQGRDAYDYVLMDCPPSLNVLTLNALCAAKEVLIPLQPHYLALQGLGKLLETVSLVNKRINPELLVTGVVVCLQDANTKLGGEVLADVRDFFENDRGKGLPWSSARVFDSVVRRNIKLAESPSYGKSIYDYAPDSNGAKDYDNLVREITGKLEVAAAPEPAVKQVVAVIAPSVAAVSPPAPVAVPAAAIKKAEHKRVEPKPIEAMPVAAKLPIAAKPPIVKTIKPKPQVAKAIEPVAKDVAPPAAAPIAIAPLPPSAPATQKVEPQKVEPKPIIAKPPVVKPTKLKPQPIKAVEPAPTEAKPIVETAPIEVKAATPKPVEAATTAPKPPKLPRPKKVVQPEAAKAPVMASAAAPPALTVIPAEPIPAVPVAIASAPVSPPRRIKMA